MALQPVANCNRLRRDATTVQQVYDQQICKPIIGIANNKASKIAVCGDFTIFYLRL